jgi:hypothetical protein
MEMIERYLEAVKFWLPKRQKDDIIEEISADIDSQIEEREAGLGRELSEAEIESILQHCGDPMKVANRYLPQEQLIGPLLFPIYRFVLKIMFLCCLLPTWLSSIWTIVYDHVYRAQQIHTSWLAAFASAWSVWLTTAFVTAGMVTLGFAVVERIQQKSHFLDEWSPRKLPPVRNPNQIQRSTSIFELAFALLFFVWWAFIASAQTIHLGNSIRVELSSQWVWFFWGYLALAAANVVLSSANLLHPYWNLRRASLRLLSDFAGAALFCLLLRAHVVTGFFAASLTNDQSLQVIHVLDSWMDKAFPWSIVVSLVIVAVGVYRVVRVKPQGASTA